MHNRNLNFDLVVRKLEVDMVAILHLELLSDRGLVEDLVLEEGNEMTLQICVLNLHTLNQVVEGDCLLVIEDHQNAHLVS
jgi:hypothetical protein